ncbi:hypothetical protein GGR50DRAFT_696801 [Xylaria sp. CBS 124048]|nr:hypothetical protein GGR50DRAFT_696801 [Xylaria sp. CBS 124048]
MAHTIQTSRSRSSTAHLAPAPLRIPRRKTVTDVHEDYENDVAVPAVVRRRRDRARDISSDPALSQKYPTRYLQSDTTTSLSGRRGTGPRLEPLLPHFERPYVVNNTDKSVLQHMNSSYKPGLDTIPRATRSKNVKRHDRAVYPPSPTESTSLHSSSISPGDIRTPFSFGARGRPKDRPDSTCLKGANHENMNTDKEQNYGPLGGPLTSYYTTESTSRGAGKGHSLVADRRRLFEGNESYCSFTTSSIPISRQSKSFREKRHGLPNSKSSPKNYPSIPKSSPVFVSSLRAAIGKRPDKVSRRQEITPKSKNDTMPPTTSSTTSPQPKPSVAYLRQSFERKSKPIPPPRLSPKPKLLSKSPHRGITTQRQDMLPPTTSSKHCSGWLAGHLTIPSEKSDSNLLVSDRNQISHVGLNTKKTEQSHPPLLRDPVKQKSTPLPKSQSIPQQTLKRTEIPYRSANWRSLSQLVDENLSQDWENSFSLDALDGLSDSTFSEERMDVTAPDASVARNEKPVVKAFGGSPSGIPKAMTSGGQLGQIGGKVRQLRRIFEQSSWSFSSSLSILNLRLKSDPEESTEALMARLSTSSMNDSASSSSTHTIARRPSIVPSLSTEISVNDFFCDFDGSLTHEGSPILTTGEEVTDADDQVRRESPVKSRIQHFELLSRDSLSLRPPVGGHGGMDEAGPLSVFKDNYEGKGKRNMAGGWRPIHRRGAAFWRKVSGSFSRPLDSWKDGKDSGLERISSREDPSPSTNRHDSPSSLIEERRRGARQSSSFGYSLHRVSPHIQPNGDRPLPNEPETNPPLLPVRNGFPIIARIASGLGLPHRFGLDGHILTKPVPDEEPAPVTRTSSSPSGPQSDPNALLKVMLEQSAAERSRRRQDEKHLHRDKLRNFAKWKGRGKSDEVDGSADDIAISEAYSKKYDKVKDKGKGILKKVSRGHEKPLRGEREGIGHMSKTNSGFAIFETKDVKLRQPAPRRPGQIKKLANMYRDKGSSGASIDTKASSGMMNPTQEGRQGLRQRASSALGLRAHKGPSKEY